MKDFWKDLLEYDPVIESSMREFRGYLATHRQSICILVGGYAGTGKDSISDYLTEWHGFTRFAFADPVKKLVKTVYCIQPEHEIYFSDRSLKEVPIPGYGLSSRQMTQRIGDGIREIAGADIWCENLWRRYLASNLPTRRIVISDLRRSNEATWFDDKFDQVVRIRLERNGCDGSVGFPNHPTETDRYTVDYAIDNDGTIRELHEKIENILKERELS